MTSWYVSPTGHPHADGTLYHPRTFESLTGTGSPVVAGDSITMREGTYTPLEAGRVPGGGSANNGTAGVAGKGVYTPSINGVSGHQITIRNYPGESVRINGSVHGRLGIGSYITFRGIEIAPTPTTRYFAVEANIDFPSLYINTPGIKFINCYLHDFSGHHPFGTGDYEVHGCIIGWIGNYADVGNWLNYNMYGHNHPGGLQSLRKNVFLYPASNWNIAMWSATINNIRDYLVEYNIMVNGQIIAGSAAGTGCDNNIIRYNYQYCSKKATGGLSTGAGIRSQAADNTAAEGEDVTYEHNYSYSEEGGGAFDYFWTRETVSRYNTMITRSTPATVASYRAPTGAVIANDIDFNTYGAFFENGTPKTEQFYNYAVPGSRSFVQWQSDTGWDANSTMLAALPSTNVTGVIDNDYQTGRGFVYIYNYEGISDVTVDISSLGIMDGAYCKYYNCANMDEFKTFRYNAASPTLSIPMEAGDWTRRESTAFDWPVPFHTESFPKFGVFLVEQLEQAPSWNIQTTENLSDSVRAVYVPHYNY